MKQLKVLHIVRHAKSSWDYEGTADIDRTLKAKGIQAAYEVARKMKLTNLVPEKIYSSPANRAMHTAVIFSRIFEFPLSGIEITNVLYESSPDKLMDLIREIDDDVKSVMIFGHNPDFTDLANRLLKSPIDGIPTCGAVTLKFNTSSWGDISKNNLEKSVLNFPSKNK